MTYLKRRSWTITESWHLFHVHPLPFSRFRPSEAKLTPPPPLQLTRSANKNAKKKHPLALVQTCLWASWSNNTEVVCVCVCVYWKLVKIPTCGGPRTDRHKWTYGATTSAIRGIITNLGLSGPTKKRAPDWLGYTEDFFLPSCFWGFITYNMISNKPIHMDPY